MKKKSLQRIEDYYYSNGYRGSRKRYVLSTDQDYEILGKVYRLEQVKLSDKDKALIRLIRTQLEHHWRTPILNFLDKLLNKYKIRKL